MITSNETHTIKFPFNKKHTVECIIPLEIKSSKTCGKDQQDV